MRLNKVLSFVWGWMLIIVCVVGSVRTMALNPDFYIQRYEKMEMASSLEVSDQDLSKSITRLLDYIKGEADDLSVTITVQGQKKEAFNEKEKRHMVDVRNLYQNAFRTGCVSFAGLLLILFFLLVTQRKKTAAYLSQGLLRAGLCLGILLAVFGFWILTDFNSFWNWFHTLFFSNDLWLLDPATDFMINMLPETIFYQLVLSCVFMLGILLVPCFAGALYYTKKKVPIGYNYENDIS